MLLVTGMTVSGGLADHLTSSFTQGTVAAGSSQTVTVRFSPRAAGSLGGTITVNGDQTGGVNTIAISGTGMATMSGTFAGSYLVERCDGTGSMQDLLCSAQRGIFPPGTPLPIRLSVSQSGGTVTGTLALGQVTGPVSGAFGADGVLSLSGTVSSGTLSAQITNWRTTLQGNTLTGTASFAMVVSGVPGTGVLVVRLQNVNRQ